jgi:hypothetical protein
MFGLSFSLLASCISDALNMMSVSSSTDYCLSDASSHISSSVDPNSQQLNLSLVWPLPSSPKG